MKIDQSLKSQALKAAFPFGGFALEFQKPILDELAGEGLVEITCYDTVECGYGYVLTSKGKTARNELM